MAVSRPTSPVTGALLAFAGRLRFPWLFAFTVGLFLVDLIVPDPIPFADEILLGLCALLLSRWKKQREAGAGSTPAAP